MQNEVDVAPFWLNESDFARQVRRATYRFISAADHTIQLRTLPEQLGISQPLTEKAIETLANRFEVELTNTPQGLVVYCSEAE